MQYLTYTNSDTNLLVREGARGNDFATDVELVANGFATGTENVDWENIDKITPQ